MSMELDITIPSRILFGSGRLAEAGDVTHALGRRALIVTGRTPSRAQALLEVLDEAGVDQTTFSVPGEPEVPTVREAVAEARRTEAEVIVGFGGGAALDTAKAAAILAPHDGDVLDYLEIIGAGRELHLPPLPFVAIPTTAGSGAEATWNAVIASREHRVKVSLRHRLMIAWAVIADPETTYALPPAVTASTGMDALTQCLEAYASVRANVFTDVLSLQGVELAARALPRAATAALDPEARADMMMAGLLGGIVLANAGLGAVHGIAGPLGGMLTAPHGSLCAALLPDVVDTNIRALRERAPGTSALTRYQQVAAALTGRADAAPEDGVAFLKDLTTSLGIPRLGAHGLRSEDLPELVTKAARASSMKGNPLLLTDDELTRTIAAAL
jgi:alcohol dehydrogenase class IV